MSHPPKMMPGPEDWQDAFGLVLAAALEDVDGANAILRENRDHAAMALALSVVTRDLIAQYARLWGDDEHQVYTELRDAFALERGF